MLLKLFHLPAVGLVVKSEQVQDPVNEQLAHFSLRRGMPAKRISCRHLGTKYDVSQQWNPIFEFAGVTEAKDIRFVVLAAVLTVQSPDPARADKSD